MFPHLPQVFASNPLDPLLWAIDTSRNEVQWQWDQFLGMQSQHDETWPPLWLWSCLMCSHRGWPFCPGVEIKNYHCKTIMTINSFSPWSPWAVGLLWGGWHSASATCCPNPAVEKNSVHVSSCFSTICSRCPYGLLGVFRLFSPFIFTCKVHGVFLVALNMKQVNATPNDQVSEGLFAGVSVTIIPIVLPAQVNGIGGFSPFCFFNDGMLFQPGFSKSDHDRGWMRAPERQVDLIQGTSWNCRLVWFDCSTPPGVLLNPSMRMECERLSIFPSPGAWCERFDLFHDIKRKMVPVLLPVALRWLGVSPVPRLTLNHLLTLGRPAVRRGCGAVKKKGKDCWCLQGFCPFHGALWNRLTRIWTKRLNFRELKRSCVETVWLILFWNWLSIQLLIPEDTSSKSQCSKSSNGQNANCI